RANLHRLKGRNVQKQSLLCAVFVVCSVLTALGDSNPAPEVFSVLPAVPSGPQITPYLQYQTDMAWREDEKRVKTWDAIRTEQDLLRVQRELRQKLLGMLGGLPSRRTPLKAQVTGQIAMD